MSKILWVSVGLALAGYVVVADVLVHDADGISGSDFLWGVGSFDYFDSILIKLFHVF